MSTRTTTPKVKTPPPWATDPKTRLVGCFDGPYVNQWFFLEEWQGRITAAKNMLALGQRRSAVLDYVENGTMQHPEWEMTQGAKMVHRPEAKR